MKSLQSLYRVRLAEGGIAAGDTTPMMVFPVGEWHSAKYPDLPLSEDLANELIANFEGGVLGTEPVVDSSGRHDTSAPAAGWVKRVYLASYEEGEVTGLALWADVKWTELGASLLADEQYKYGSVEIGPVTLNDTGETVDNVLRSLTLTNTPVLRLMPGVQDAAAKQRDVVTLSLAEFALADDEDDPVAALMEKGRTWASDVDAALKGRKGMPSFRALFREAMAKVSAHKLAEPGSVNDEREALEAAVQDAYGAMSESVYVEDFGPDWVIFHVWRSGEGSYYRATYERSESGITLGQPVEVKRETTFVPVSDGASGAASPSRSQAVAIGEAGEGAGGALAEDPAAQKGVDHRMNSKALTILKLAEDATDDAQSAAVLALAEERDTAVKQLADRDKADRTRDFEAKLAEALAEKDGVVHMLPGEKDTYLKLAEIDHEAAMAAVQARIDGPAALKLGATGSSSEGDSDEAKPADVELAEKAKARATKDGITVGEAQKLTLAEDPDLAQRIQSERYGKGA